MNRTTCTLAGAIVAMLPTASADARPDYPRRTTATSYCLNGRMADGTTVRGGSAASNVLRLGTRITLDRGFFGRRRFVIRDTGSALWDGHLDLWASSCAASARWGRRRIAYRIGWAR